MIHRLLVAPTVLGFLVTGCGKPGAGLPSLPILFLASDQARVSPQENPGPDLPEAEARAAHLAFRSLPPAAALAWSLQLDELTTRLELSANPLGVDLDEGNPAQAVRQLLSRRLPAVTAARRIARLRWWFEGGAVRVAPSCSHPHRATETCIPLRAERETPEEGAARFAAWPLTYAVVLRASPARAERVISALRALADQEEGTVALALSGEDLVGTARPGEEQLGAHARRLARLLDRADVSDFQFLADWAQIPVQDSLLPAIELGADEMLVVPRMGALARLADFKAELDSALAPFVRDVEWVQGPPSNRVPVRPSAP